MNSNMVRPEKFANLHLVYHFTVPLINAQGSDVGKVVPNPLSANPTKWSNTLKQFVGYCRRIVSVCLTILWGWRLKG